MLQEGARGCGLVKQPHNTETTLTPCVCMCFLILVTALCRYIQTPRVSPWRQEMMHAVVINLP